jgi:hypothetical protein
LTDFDRTREPRDAENGIEERADRRLHAGRDVVDAAGGAAIRQGREGGRDIAHVDQVAGGR